MREIYARFLNTQTSQHCSLAKLTYKGFSLFIISVCSAQNPTESLLEDVIEDLSVHNDVDNAVNELNWEDELEELSVRLGCEDWEV